MLVVNQKAKLIEINNEYAIFDQNARQLAAVREVGQSNLKKAARFLTSLDQYMTHQLQIVDMAGNVQLALTRPAKFVKSRIIVQDPGGNEIGQIVQQNVFSKIRFSLESGGHTYGSINAENWRAWNFSIRDHTETEVARITKTWEGLAKTMFTTADNFIAECTLFCGCVCSLRSRLILFDSIVPLQMPVAHKALILASVILLDFTYFEQKNNNNNVVI